VIEVNSGALFTPSLLLPRVVREVVAPGFAGAYVLGNDHDGFKVGYVGRSDTCLRSRLLAHSYLCAFEYFIFLFVDHVAAAFYAECELYHAYRQLNTVLANRLHPAAPSADVGCRYCAFASSWRVTQIRSLVPVGLSRKALLRLDGRACGH
jgi:hypothetical protein